MLNLREETEGINIILKAASKRIPHDKFSALCYGLYYVKEIEESKSETLSYPEIAVIKEMGAKDEKVNINTV